jgi:hypothetical protein
VAIATQNGPPNFRLKRNLIVLAAMIANDLESLRLIFTLPRFLRPALRTPLRRHHVALVKDLLLLFGEKKGLFTLNARCFDVRHTFSPGYEYIGLTRQF